MEGSLSGNAEVEAILEAAQAHFDGGRPGRAIRPLARAVAIEPENAIAHWYHGQALLATSRHGEALAAFDGGAALRPDMPQMHEFRGMALHNMGRHEEALRAIGRVLSIDAEYPRAHFNMGLSLSALGRHEEALDAYDRAAVLADGARGKPRRPGPSHPDDGEIRAREAASLYALGRVEEAVSWGLGPSAFARKRYRPRRGGS